jgi:3-oxoacyl-[acyl-carrier protein] reductase
MIDTGLDGKVVLVTGANNPHGIGAAVAKAFATQRAKLFLHYFRTGGIGSRAAPDRVESVTSPGEAFYHSQQVKSPGEVLAAIRDSGGQADAWEADLADATAIPELFERAEKALGPVEVLVNNAAHWEGDTFGPAGADLPNKLHELWTDRPRNITAEGFDRIFHVNVRAPALLMSEFARRQTKRAANWGRIINVSTAGAYCFPSEISYGASKLALEGYTRSAAAELGQFGITVNAVSLGPVQTGWVTPELEKEILPTIPIGRIGSPEEVADVIVFLASAQARWVTGQRIFVGGGHGM